MSGFKPVPAASTESLTVFDRMSQALYNAGRENFTSENGFENCLCALILAYNPSAKAYQILDALPHKDRSMGASDLLNIMARLGFYSRRIKVKPQDIDPRLLPCLITDINGGDPYILFDNKTDENIGHKYVRRISDADKKTSYAYIFQPYDENRTPTSKFMRQGTRYGWFRALMQRFRKNLIQIFIAGFFLNLLALATPLFIMLVYDRVIAANAPDVLPLLAIGALGALVLEWVMRNLRSKGLSWLAGRMDNIISNKIFSHLLGLSPELIERASISSQIARIKTFEAIRDFFSGSVFLSLLELPFVMIAAIAIYAIAGPLVFVPLGFGFLYVSLFYSVRHKVKSAIRLAAKATSARQAFTIEGLEKIESLRLLGMTEKWLARYRLLSGQERVLHFRLNRLGIFGETIAHGLTLMAAVATVGFGVSMVWAGSLSTGALVATMILVWRVLTPFYSLCTMIPRLEQIRNSIIQVNKLMEIDTEETELKTLARLPKIDGRIGFQNVSLNYAGKSDTVLNGLSFVIKPGEVLALTGENGSGKTSILKLIQGLYRPDDGAVQIDGFDIRQLNAHDLRRQVSYVPQLPEFFAGSIAENMRAVHPMATINDIEEALKAADAYEDVMKLEDGLDSHLGSETKSHISVSLRTRLSLARGYLHPSPLMLIDEIPNTILGSKTGRNLKKYIENAKGKKTVIFVTYRRDYMALADRIILLHRGEPAETVKFENIQQKLFEREAA